MSIATLSANDVQTRNLVLAQLAWDSQVDASGIGVTARDGTVTLTGFIDSYAGKLAAERAAKRIRGVRAVANDVQVRLRLERTDPEIAAEAAAALKTRDGLADTVQVVVHGGHLTLTGTVASLFERAVAEQAVRHIRGAKGVINRIELRPRPSIPDIRRQIIRALHRDAELNARAIAVEVSGSTVTLRGEVVSWHERDAAERAAMHEPGITHVDNQIVVKWLEMPALSDDVEDEIC